MENLTSSAREAVTQLLPPIARLIIEILKLHGVDGLSTDNPNGGEPMSEWKEGREYYGIEVSVGYDRPNIETGEMEEGHRSTLTVSVNDTCYLFLNRYGTWDVSYDPLGDGPLHLRTLLSKAFNHNQPLVFMDAQRPPNTRITTAQLCQFLPQFLMFRKEAPPPIDPMT